MATEFDREAIYVDIVETGRGWRAIGICPPSVAASEGLHVYRGRNARVLDCATDAEIASGTSLRDVLARLANGSGRRVVLTDETTWAVETFDPPTATAPVGA